MAVRPAIAILVLALALPAMGDTVSLVASKDNTLFEMAGHPDLSSGQGELFAGGIAQQDPNGNAYRRRALVQFNLDAIPAGATITGATLRMQVTRTISAGYQFDVYRMLASWGEGASNSGTAGRGAAPAPGDVTWNLRFFGDPASAWATPGGDFDPAVQASQLIAGAGSYNWSGPGLVSNVQGWLDGTLPNDGWMITSELEFLTTIAKRFASRESGTVSSRPTLIVNYTVPAPSSGLALGLLAGLALRRRR